ncbi:Abc transporter g family member 3-like, partial [Thalictrum thalictroides]
MVKNKLFLFLALMPYNLLKQASSISADEYLNQLKVKLKDDHGDFSSVNMDTAVAIRTLEATYRSSNDAAAVESMMLRLTEKDGPLLKRKGKASTATRVAVLTWRSLLIMSREWRYFWLRLILFMVLSLCVGTIFSNLGHSLSSVVVRVTAIFVFVSFASLLSISGLPAHIEEIK